jgi:hypothetical protein
MRKIWKQIVLLALSTVAVAVLLPAAAVSASQAPQFADQLPHLNAAPVRPPYLDPAQPVAGRVKDLLGRMTLEEKRSGRRRRRRYARPESRGASGRVFVSLETSGGAARTRASARTRRWSPRWRRSLTACRVMGGRRSRPTMSWPPRSTMRVTATPSTITRPPLPTWASRGTCSVSRSTRASR